MMEDLSKVMRRLIINEAGGDKFKEIYKKIFATKKYGKISSGARIRIEFGNFMGRVG
jgi:hypothetical protein